MIPVRMGYEDIGVYGAFPEVIRHKPVAKGLYPRAKIDDHEPAVGPYFKARGIAPVFNGGRSGTGDGTPVSPKTHA